MGGEVRVLAVDDEEPIRILLKEELSRRGYQVTVAAEGESALRLLADNHFDAVLLDLKMPGIDGMEVLRRVKGEGLGTEVLILTGHADVDSAIAAMKLGAFDYLTKPFRLAEVDLALQKAVERTRLSRENLALRTIVERHEAFPEIVGTSPEIRSVLGTVTKVAPSDSTVLIQGESGTGKELVARAIHLHSLRTDKPFLAINCGAFQDELLESELFGHEKGAFTGATGLKHGLFEVAEGGALFLDEVGEMSSAMQVKLLRVLDTGEVRRVGSNKILRVNVRIISASNKNLRQSVEEGRFRSDLFYRLNVVTLTLPPLRERPGDIPLLVAHIMRRLEREGQKPRRFSSEAVEALMTYPWPGNIRELENVVERVLLLAEKEEIAPEDLPLASPSPVSAPPPEEDMAMLTLEEVERQHILRVLAHCGGNKSLAARRLGIDVKTLRKKATTPVSRSSR